MVPGEPCTTPDLRQALEHRPFPNCWLELTVYRMWAVLCWGLGCQERELCAPVKAAHGC